MKRNHRPESDSVYTELSTAQQHLQLTKEELTNTKSRVVELEGTNERKQLLIQELRAELALMKVWRERAAVWFTWTM